MTVQQNKMGENNVALVIGVKPQYWGNQFPPPGDITVSGTGKAGSTITLGGWASGPACTTTVASNGTWSCVVAQNQIPFANYNILFGPGHMDWVDPFNVEGSSTWTAPAYLMITVKATISTSPSVQCSGTTIKLYYGWTTPIAIDFSGTGSVQTVPSIVAPGLFNFGAQGVLHSGWLAPSAGFVAYDKDGDGKITSIDELFGGGIGDGFAKLATFDTNGDGVIDARDAGYWKLSIWRDYNMNKITDPGELMSLPQAGVVSIHLGHTDYWELDAAGNGVYEHSYAILSNGQRAAMNDVYFQAG
jgi:hypothetical protein